MVYLFYHEVYEGHEEKKPGSNIKDYSPLNLPHFFVHGLHRLLWLFRLGLAAFLSTNYTNSTNCFASADGFSNYELRELREFENLKKQS